MGHDDECESGTLICCHDKPLENERIICRACFTAGSHDGHDFYLCEPHRPSVRPFVCLIFMLYTCRFVLYKLPESSSRGGDGYVYRTSIDVVETGSSSSGSGGTWIPSNRSIGASSSLPGQTLDPIYSTRVTIISRLFL